MFWLRIIRHVGFAKTHQSKITTLLRVLWLLRGVDLNNCSMVRIHNNSATQETPSFYPTMLKYSSSSSARATTDLLPSCYLVTYRLTCERHYAVCQFMASFILHTAFETIQVPIMITSLNCQAGFCQVTVQIEELLSTSFRILDKLFLSTYSGKDG